MFVNVGIHAHRSIEKQVTLTNTRFASGYAHCLGLGYMFFCEALLGGYNFHFISLPFTGLDLALVSISASGFLSPI